MSCDEIFLPVEMGQYNCPSFFFFLSFFSFYFFFNHYNYFYSDVCSIINDHHIRDIRDTLLWHTIVLCTVPILIVI